MRQGLVGDFAKMKACIDKFRPNTSQANCCEGYWRITHKIKAKIVLRKQKNLCAQFAEQAMSATQVLQTQ